MATSNLCPVVGVGASTGGPEAFRRFLSSVPAETGVAFVLVQHPRGPGARTELLDRHARIPVTEATRVTVVEPDHAYVIPPGKSIKLEGDRLFLKALPEQHGVSMPIDYFFRSLAEARREKAVGVLLTGTGADGAMGIKEVKAAGGLAVVQDPSTAEYEATPAAAVATGVVDLVAPAEELPQQILGYLQRSQSEVHVERAASTMTTIVNVLASRTDLDFRCYKSGTLQRRIQRRMALQRLESLDVYLQTLRDEPDEVQRLFKDLLIGVTRFFRDGEAWSEIAAELRRIVASREDNAPIRIWVPGCATGEEAYSLAILLEEAMEAESKRIDLQIFATDLDEDSIAHARSGLYSASIAQDVGPDRLARFFALEGERYRIAQQLRESMVFAVQNLVTDAPFSNLDLISCRNVLIYLEAETQRRILRMFHFALRDAGLLFLGSSESVGQESRLFSLVSSSSRLFRMRPGFDPGHNTFPIIRTTGRDRREATVDARGSVPGSTGVAVEAAKRHLLDRFAPASVLINQKYEVQYYHGPVRRYLDFPTGEPTSDLIAMTLEGLRGKVRALVLQTLHDGKIGTDVASRVFRDDEVVPVRVTAERISQPRGDDPMVLVTFTDERPAEPMPASEPPSEREASALEQLEIELHATRDDLQSTIEELETSNEELKASNEEVMSMNEELQSANEELETSREELQSLNEELTSVNEQLEDKVLELGRTNDDLANLLSSTAIATLFLDTNLRLRRFTPAAIELLNVGELDVGRHLSDLPPLFHDPELIPAAKGVLERLAPVQAEVPFSDGRWFLRRVLPYRTADNRIEGVVITFSDVTNLKEATRRLQIREQQQAVVAELGRIALAEPKLERLYDAWMARVSSTLEMSHVGLFAAEPDGLRLLAGAGSWRSGAKEALVPHGRSSPLGEVRELGEPVVVASLSEEKHFFPVPIFEQHGLVAFAGVPVGPDNARWGVLAALHEERVSFSGDDINFLRAAAHVLGEAVRNREAEAAVQRALDELELVHRATLLASETTSMEEALQRCVDTVCTMTGWPTGHAYLPDETGKQMVTTGLWHLDDEERLRPLREASTARRFVPGDGLVGRIWSSKKPVWVEDVATGLDHVRATACVLSGVRAGFGFPVLIDGEVAGVLEFFLHEPRQPDRHLMNAVETLGGQVGRVMERVRSMHALAERQKRLDLAVAGSGAGVWEWDLRTGDVSWNDAQYRLAGYEPGEVTPSAEAWLARIHPEDRAEAERQLEAARDDESAYRGEYRVLLPNGDVRWIDARGWTLTGQKGPGRMYGLAWDVTDRRLAEERISEARRWFEQIAETSPDIISIHDPLNNRTVYSNRQLKELLGYESDLGEKPVIELRAELVHPDDREETVRFYASLAELPDGIVRERVHRVRHADGRWLSMQVRARPFRRDEEGRLTQVLAVSRDVTELEVVNEKLREADRRKDEFLAVLGHELRNPLSGIRGGIEVLELAKDEATRTKARSMMKRQAAQLVSILDEALDVTRISRGDVRLVRRRTEIGPLVERAITSASAGFESKGHRLECKVEPGLVAVVDPTRFEQIVVNLLTNAAKYMPRGGTAELAASSVDGMLQLSVTDEGAGLDAHTLDRIFEPFFQAHDDDYAGDGLGLGLALVKRLVDAHGGTVAARSDGPGRGSVFTVRVPLRGPEAVGAVRETPPAGTRTFLPQRMILVEDKTDVAEGLVFALRAQGMIVEVAKTGGEAIEMAKRQKPQAMIIDLGLPDVSGFEVARAVRAEADLKGCVLVALSGFGHEQARKDAFEAGFDHHVAKPAASLHLLELIASPN